MYTAGTPALLRVPCSPCAFLVRRARARQVLVAATLSVLGLAAVIVARQSVGYRRGSSHNVVLEQTRDPFMQELSAMHASKQVRSQIMAQRSKAEALLVKARSEMKTRGPEINKLLEHSEELDFRLAEQEAAEKQMATAVEAARQKVARLKAIDEKMHMTIGWPQNGGAMPTAYPSFDKAPSLFDADSEAGPLRTSDTDNGVDAAAIQAAAKAIAEAYAEQQGMPAAGVEVGSAEDWNGNELRPNKVQHMTARHGEGADDEWSNWQRREENTGFPAEGSPYESYADKPMPVIVVDGKSGVSTTAGDNWWSNPLEWFKTGTPSVRSSSRAPWDGEASVDSPDVQRVKKLMDIQRTKADLREQEQDLQDQVFEDAQNGKLSHQDLPEDAKIFSAGFIQGAVEASKQSVEQQGKFANQVSEQGALVKELEDLVHTLENKKRLDNFAKTAAAVAKPVPVAVVVAAPAPAPVPARAVEPVASAGYVAPKPGKDFKKIQIDFYMEAECPGCKAFTTGLLTDTLNALGDWVELRAIPYGNAQLNNSVIDCQHGEDECIGNKIMLCMMKRYGVGGDWQAWYPAFKCIEASDDSPENASKTCLPDSGMDKAAILECAKGSEGDLLHMAAAQMTIDLDPPHKWTPWLVMNGKPMEDKTEKILSEVCKKLPADAQIGIPQCSPKYKAIKGASSLMSHPKIQKCYPTDPLSELVLGEH